MSLDLENFHYLCLDRAGHFHYLKNTPGNWHKYLFCWMHPSNGRECQVLLKFIVGLIKDFLKTIELFIISVIIIFLFDFAFSLAN